MKWPRQTEHPIYQSLPMIQPVFFWLQNLRECILFLVAIKNRLIANAVRLELKGQLMRRKNQK